MAALPGIEQALRNVGLTASPERAILWGLGIVGVLGLCYLWVTIRSLIN